MRQRVLFLCTHNSARSQMAEGMVRAWAGDRYDPFSAGTEATAVRLQAIEAMAEIGIDITGQWSKALDLYLDQPFDLVVTVCDDAVPYFPGAGRIEHWHLEDPSIATGSEEERLEAYRQVRDRLAVRIRAELLRA